MKKSSRSENYVKMDKIKSILASASGRRAGPPVPPRPSPAAVQKALEKVRPAAQSHPPIVQGRTVVYSSTDINNCHADHRAPLNNVSCEIKCFDTKSDDSSTGLATKDKQNGNSAHFKENVYVVSAGKQVNENKAAKVEPTRVILHQKSPVARPRSKTPTKSEPQVSTTLINAPGSEINGYANLLMRNPNFPHHSSPPDDATTVRSRRNIRDDELKEKLLNEMMNRSNKVEATNRHIKYNGSNLKRSSSFDVLNDSPVDKSVDKKVIFHEILISELSEMRRSSRLSSAKSSPDISPNGNLKFFEMNDKKSDNTFVSLEDSGVEDEGKMDDCWSSGVGDSWDSCKEMENR